MLGKFVGWNSIRRFVCHHIKSIIPFMAYTLDLSATWHLYCDAPSHCGLGLGVGEQFIEGESFHGVCVGCGGREKAPKRVDEEVDGILGSGGGTEGNKSGLYCVWGFGRRVEKLRENLCELFFCFDAGRLRERG